MRDNWQRLALGDVATTPPAGTFNPTVEASTPYVGMEHLDPGRREIARFGSSDETASSKTRFLSGDVLYGKLRPYLRKVALAGSHGVCSTEITILRSLDEAVITPEFLYYFCTDERLLRYAIDHSAGTRMPRVSPSQLLKAPIEVPPAEEQRRIANLLGSADLLLTLNEQHQAALAALLAAHIDRVASAHTDRKVLSDVAEIRSGLAKGRKSSGATVSVPFLRAANVQDGQLDLADIHELEVSPAEISRYELRDGDVLLVEGSGSPSRLGTGWIWESEVPGCIHQNHVFAVRSGDHLNPRWLAYWITSSPARSYFLSCVKTTSGLGTINKKQVSRLPIAVPPLAVQSDAVELLDSARDALMLATARAGELTSLKSALLSALLSGAHEIPESYDRFLDESALADELEPLTV